MSKSDRIILIQNCRNRLPFVCNFNNCFFDGIIDDYPYFSKSVANRYSHAVYFHIPCAMMVNLI